MASELRAWKRTVDARATRYRLVLWMDGGSMFVAWPDKGWCAGNLGSFVGPEWLEEHGLSRADAEVVAAELAVAWQEGLGR
jgi:hypothetical protein